MAFGLWTYTLTTPRTVFQSVGFLSVSKGRLHLTRKSGVHHSLRVLFPAHTLPAKPLELSRKTSGIQARSQPPVVGHFEIIIYSSNISPWNPLS